MMGDEADAIGWEWSMEDIEKEDRERTGKLNDFEKMLAHFGYEESDWLTESGNEKRRIAWNWNNVVNKKETNKAAFKRYAENKTVSIGANISCATCGKLRLKKSYQTQFCKRKGKNNCKDVFWNYSGARYHSRLLGLKRDAST